MPAQSETTVAPLAEPPIPIPYAHDPGHTGPEVRAALSPENKARFEAAWRKAMAAAVCDFDLGPAQEVLRVFRNRAILDVNPELMAGVPDALERIKDGTETFVRWVPPSERENPDAWSAPWTGA